MTSDAEVTTSSESLRWRTPRLRPRAADYSQEPLTAGGPEPAEGLAETRSHGRPVGEGHGASAGERAAVADLEPSQWNRGLELGRQLHTSGFQQSLTAD